MDSLSNSAIWWILGIIAAVISTGMIAWLTALHTRLHVYGEEIAVLKSQMVDVKSVVNDIKADLSEAFDRLNAKLDRILERQ